MRRRPRWILTISVVVVALGFGVWTTFFDKQPEKCKPVTEMLNFNRSQSALISSKGGDGAPNAAEQTAYQQWADGLAERAQKVTDPQLAAKATDLAQLAGEFVAGLPRMRAETEARAPGAPAPAVLYQMSALNDQITTKISELSQACS
ncbi:MAG TPA: hypothetical protein VMD51_08935 [Mycobacterium sp.]|nr:hypothetical protein [Mycobacterium sp.]